MEGDRDLKLIVQVVNKKAYNKVELPHSIWAGTAILQDLEIDSMQLRPIDVMSSMYGVHGALVAEQSKQL